MARDGREKAAATTAERPDLTRCHSLLCPAGTSSVKIPLTRQDVAPALPERVIAAVLVAETAIDIRPFQVEILEEQLVELRRRIEATRWPSQELVADRSQGVQLTTLQALARYWTTDYDWRKAEAKLTALLQFTTEIDGVTIHFIHVKSRHENALPLIMTHGWPGSVIELLGTVGPLTDPTAHGGTAEDAFHLAPSPAPATGSRASRPSSAGSPAAPHVRGRS